jgi:hypothetical protein
VVAGVKLLVTDLLLVETSLKSSGLMKAMSIKPFGCLWLSDDDWDVITVGTPALSLKREKFQ